MNNLSGTDGIRLLCHQFSSSSLPRHARSKKVQDVLAQDEAQDASSPPIVGKRRPGPKYQAYSIPASQWPTVVHCVLEMKRFVASYFMHRSSMDSKNLSCTVSEIEYVWSSPVYVDAQPNRTRNSRHIELLHNKSGIAQRFPSLY